MKKYASKKAHKGRTAYRTPSRFTPHLLKIITKKKANLEHQKGAGFIYKSYKKINKKRAAKSNKP